MKKTIIILFVFAPALFFIWYFGLYLPQTHACNNQDGMAVHSVYPWGVKCTSYEEAFQHWNRNGNSKEVIVGKDLSLKDINDPMIINTITGVVLAMTPDPTTCFDHLSSKDDFILKSFTAKKGELSALFQNVTDATTTVSINEIQCKSLLETSRISPSNVSFSPSK